MLLAMAEEQLEPACDAPWKTPLLALGAAVTAAAALLYWRATAIWHFTFDPIACGSVSIGLAAAAIGHAAAIHLLGHQRESQRLRLPLELRLWPLKFQLARSADAAQRLDWKWKSSLVRLAGGWANRRLTKYRFDIAGESLILGALSMVLLFTLPAGSLPPKIMRILLFVNFASAAVSLIVLALWQANQLVAVASQAEIYERPLFYPRNFRAWPFWEHLFQRSRLDQKLYGRDHRLILRAAGLNGRKTVLELGCGASVIWEHLPRPRRLGWIHVDVDLASLIAARSRGRGRICVCADASKLPFRNESMDIVVALTLFDAVIPETIEPILSEARRVLKPGGLVVHLQDFPDWPGQELAEQFNEILTRAGRDERVAFDPVRKRLFYPSPSSGRRTDVLAALRRNHPSLPPHVRDRSSVLERLIAEDKGSLERYSSPNECFKLVFRETLARHAFRVASMGEELRRHLYHSAYLIARKPA